MCSLTRTSAIRLPRRFQGGCWMWFYSESCYLQIDMYRETWACLVRGKRKWRWEGLCRRNHKMMPENVGNPDRATCLGTESMKTARRHGETLGGWVSVSGEGNSCSICLTTQFDVWQSVNEQPDADNRLSVQVTPRDKQRRGVSHGIGRILETSGQKLEVVTNLAIFIPSYKTKNIFKFLYGVCWSCLGKVQTHHDEKNYIWKQNQDSSYLIAMFSNQVHRVLKWIKECWNVLWVEVIVSILTSCFRKWYRKSVANR